jgi:4-diphosphocytidyl-2-C-methyl-D-erythritol kinase
VSRPRRAPGAAARSRSTRTVAPRPGSVTVEARAKLNLGLAVGPRRGDGYHELVTVFQSVSLADTLTAQWRARGFTLVVRQESAAVRGRLRRAPGDRVPAGAGNLVLRAARLLARELSLPGGARFTLTKRIPAQAGLGGGSADAAAAIAALLALHGRRLTRAERLAFALQLGSDVPFATTGGTALGLGRGERLTRLRLRSPFRAVIAMPAWRVSTAHAFRRHDLARNSLTPWVHHRRFAATVGRQRVDALSLIRRGNRFEQLLGQRRRDLESLCARLRAAGLLEPHLTGSGSAVFGVVPRGASVREIVDRFSGDEPLYAVRSSGRGLRLRIHATASRPRKGAR